MTSDFEVIEDLLQQYPTILFMKGDKFAPRCKYSKQAVQVLDNYKLDYVTFDILQNDFIRQTVKDYSDLKTYPQFYYNGNLIGGADTLQQMHNSKELNQIFSKT